MATLFISIGSNIDKARYIRNGIADLTAQFGPLQISSVYESESVGFDGSNFYNLVCAATTSLSVSEVTALLRKIEVANGRDRSAKKFSSRTLDLDLLLYDDLVIAEPTVLPRDEIDKNAFVLWPLAELAPNLIHPLLQQNYQDLWDSFDKDKQSLWAIPFDWQGSDL
ncbi:MAG: 2-amino-4-hydroxy-6-hydroxymethyldihydropteridine diphosphokinase [Gammaproteobacteria bacterium]|nr:2-amino-4-hydroxy-6-hydroxymethyldihydropteridine diphosphokinase [Gammaproteobacteria bacterium]